MGNCGGGLAEVVGLGFCGFRLGRSVRLFGGRFWSCLG